MFGLYFHFPFCVKKCNYCAFYSRTDKNIDFPFWQDFYLKKIKNISEKPTSIYFGGGTPSLMPAKMVEKILGNFDLADVEVTLEVNPETVDKQKLIDFKNAGVNRLSIGVQSLNDDVLKFMGRIHTKKTALRVIEEAKTIYDKITIDLIYGRPNQNLKEWETELKEALSLGLYHFSLYQLSLDNGWQVNLPNEDSLRNFYDLTNQIMLDNKIPRYEISNYSKDYENQSRHNLTYWLGGDFLGIGPKAHSRVNYHEIINDINGEVEIDNLLSKKQRDTEIFLTAIRTIYGVRNELLYLTDDKKIKTMIENGFITKDKDGIKATNEGYPILDSVANFLLD